MTNPAFFGTDSETHYRDAKGRWWLVQSPDMTGDALAVPSEGPCHGAVDLRWESCRDFAALARALDAPRVDLTGSILVESGPSDLTEIVTRAEVTRRFGGEAGAWARSASAGDTEQIWEHETTLTALRGRS